MPVGLAESAGSSQEERAFRKGKRKTNKLHGYHTYNMGVHSCSGTSIWLYDGPHTGCAFVLKYYHLQRGCVGMYELLAVR